MAKKGHRCPHRGKTYEQIYGPEKAQELRLLRRLPRPMRYKLNVLLAKGVKRGRNLKKRLLIRGLLRNECYECGLKPIWRGEPLTLEMDHIDGDKTNNELSNLRMLCPNCHAQTPTSCRNKTRQPGKLGIFLS